ncbi:MAG: hypothetical protein KDI88_18730, partial [Gammaproteobacteria bacterium]|nr:hypothetical protein [Gammaproteobacteria bacterium]
AQVGHAPVEAVNQLACGWLRLHQFVVLRSGLPCMSSKNRSACAATENSAGESLFRLSRTTDRDKTFPDDCALLSDAATRGETYCRTSPDIFRPGRSNSLLLPQVWRWYTNCQVPTLGITR